MDYQNVINKRRSIRAFKDRIVSTKTIQEIIYESTYAPSSGNEQPWKFIIVHDRALMKRISSEAKETILKRIASDPHDYAAKYEGMLRNPHYNIFYNAPSVVFILGMRNQKNMRINCSLAANYFMLSAASRGLGTCWINFATFIESQRTIEELGIPHDCEIVAPIIIGYPTKEVAMPKRKAPEIIKII